MFGYDPYYWGAIRNYTIAFGKLFSDVVIERVDSSKKKAQVIKVPIAYGPKEKWLRRLQENPDLTKQIKMELPRMSFELSRLVYDPTRKIGPNSNYLMTTKHEKVSTPIPWNFDFTLYIATKTQDDTMNIIEQILPFFSPAIMLTVTMIEEPVAVINVPLTLNTINQEDNWDENWEESRIIVSTLNFTLKGFLYGPVIDSKIIKKSIATVTQNSSMTPSNVNSQYTVAVNPFDTTETSLDPHTLDEWYINW